MPSVWEQCSVVPKTHYRQIIIISQLDITDEPPLSLFRESISNGKFSFHKADSRPNGQITDMNAEKKVPKWGPCQKFDIELEIAAFVGQPNKMGEAIPVANAKDHLFGVVLMNDWSARDIQVPSPSTM
jgi:Fumarylacetoacetate (FAA) hydrolase family